MSGTTVSRRRLLAALGAGLGTALATAVEFHQAIGPARVEQRIGQLNQRLCPHILTLPEEIDQAVAAVAALA